MKATKDGYTVGIALESFDGENATTTETIEVSLPSGRETSTTVKTGKILVFVNLGYSKLDDNLQGLTSAGGETLTTNAFFIDQTTGKLTASFTADLDLKGNSLENVSKILSSNGTWSMDENGKLAVKEIETERIKSKKGYAVPDEDTGKEYCIKVKSGALIAAQGTCGDSPTFP